MSLETHRRNLSGRRSVVIGMKEIGCALVLAVGLIACSGGSYHAAKPTTTSQATTTPTSTATTAPLLQAQTGAAAGMKVPWLGVLVAPDGRELKVTYEDQCVAPRGARAIMSSTRVVVTVYAANPSPGSLTQCPSGIETQAFTLPKPVDGRSVVDGADTRATSQYVPFSRSTVSDAESTVRVYFPDRTCSRVSRASVVETDRTVTLTAIEMARSGTTKTQACAYAGDGPLVQEVHLASPIGRRRLIDGACVLTRRNAGCARP